MDMNKQVPTDPLELYTQGWPADPVIEVVEYRSAWPKANQEKALRRLLAWYENQAGSRQLDMGDWSRCALGLPIAEGVFADMGLTSSRIPGNPTKFTWGAMVIDPGRLANFFGFTHTQFKSLISGAHYQHTNGPYATVGEARNKLRAIAKENLSGVPRRDPAPFRAALKDFMCQFA